MLVIRLARAGKKHSPVYRINVAEKGAKLTGRFIEKIGTYKPGDFFKCDNNRFNYWVLKGAQPTGTLSKLMKEFRGSVS